MGKMETVECDERTEMIQNASYKLGYLAVTFALLLDIALRAWGRSESAWDLFAVVIGSGLIVSLYQWRGNIVNRAWFRVAAVAFVVGLVVSIALGVLRVF